MFLRVQRAVSAMVFAAAVSAGPASAEDGEQDEGLLAFLLGRYAIVGQEPDGGAAYSGTARLDTDGGALVLRRQVGEREIIATGRLDVPSPPGDGRVLRFTWADPDPVGMTCLIGTDLDNYARLTCTWRPKGSQPNQPGIEAMFPTAAWAPLDF